MLLVSPDTLQDALARVQPGDTVVLSPGTYRPFVVTTPGKPGSPITIRSEIRHAATITGGDRDGVQVGPERRAPDGTHWIILDGLQITKNRRDGIRGYGSSCEVRNCWIHHNGVVSPAPASGPTGMGIGWYGDHANCTFEGNRIERNGSNFWDHGLYVPGWGHRFVANVIRRNAGYGLHAYPWSTGFHFERNIVTGNGTGGIYARIRRGTGQGIALLDNASCQNGTYGIVLIDGGDVMPVCRGNLLTGNGRGPYTTGDGCPLKSLPEVPDEE